jgi:hypothetical protein
LTGSEPARYRPDPFALSALAAARLQRRRAGGLGARIPRANQNETDSPYIADRSRTQEAATLGSRLGELHRFVRENIFKPDLQRSPAVVTFWGACGSVTDGCMDYAIATASPFLICRSCCHDNIGGNTEIVTRRTPINAFFRWKNRSFARMKRKAKWEDYYFSRRYLADAYPRSAAARELMDSETIIGIARSSPDSDVCRSLIDLDRCLYLRERGYDVLYREELFFAHRRPDAGGEHVDGIGLRRPLRLSVPAAPDVAGGTACRRRCRPATRFGWPGERRTRTALRP